jgi:phosphohistidine phosphatase
MDLILWRHADAEEGARDLERKLTGKGHRQAARVAKWLAARLPSKYAVYSSPARRARETADALGVRYKIVERLAPGASVAAILAAAGWSDGKGTAIVVGHQPDLGHAAAALVSGKQADWSMRKGGLWWLTLRKREGEKQVVVRAVIGPELL